MTTMDVTTAQYPWWREGSCKAAGETPAAAPVRSPALQISGGSSSMSGKETFPPLRHTATPTGLHRMHPIGQSVHVLRRAERGAWVAPFRALERRLDGGMFSGDGCPRVSEA